jgi:hypothetical protein
MPWGRRLRQWREYTAAPWISLERLSLEPDFVFVDGRFRAASVLESLLRLPREANCIFMLDDFEGRQDHYGVILPFAADVERTGRALVFRRSPELDRKDCTQALVRAQRDPE